MRPRIAQPVTRVEFAGVGVVVAAAVLALAWSWNAWIDEPLIDIGRDLYIPELLASGATLYRDVQYVYPPLAPELLVAVVRAFGSSLGVHTGVGLAQSAAVLLSLWLLGREVAGRAGGFACAVLFVGLHLAGVSTFGCNWIVPYAHAATFGMLFFLLAELLLLVRIRRGGGDGLFVAAGAALALSAFAKVEFAVSAMVLVPMAALLGRASARAVAAVLALAASLATFAILRYGVAPLVANLFPPALLGGGAATSFYELVTGFAAPRGALLLSARGAALVVAFCALVFAFDRASGTLRVGVALALVGCGVVLVGTGDGLFRAFTLLLPVIAIVAFAREPRGELALLAAFALCGASRIPLQLSPDWYGFVYLLPLYPLLARVLFVEFPRVSRISTRNALLWLPVVAAIAVVGLAGVREVSARKLHRFDSPRGTLYLARPKQAAALSEVVADLVARRPASLLVLPEGLTLNWFTRVPLANPLYMFTPAELSVEAERRYLPILRAAPPAAVLIWPAIRHLSVFGSRGVGVDYGKEVAAFIDAEYEPAHDYARGGFRLLARKHAEVAPRDSSFRDGREREPLLHPPE